MPRPLQNSTTTVLIMAGGIGRRLKPLTDKTPKPLIRVGGQPVLEIVIQNLVRSKLRNIFLAVNYKAQMIKDHFGSGKKFGVNIQYIQELKPMGTAGALGLFPMEINKPIVVMNADLLAKIDFQKLLSFHKQHKADLTICVRDFEQQVPYGVVTTKGRKVLNVKEKPVHSYTINTGIYVIEPKLLKLASGCSYIDMPEFIDKVKQKRGSILAYSVNDYWMDIGCFEDLKRARSEFHLCFS